METPSSHETGSELSDETLMEQLMGGNVEAMATLVGRYERPLMMYLYRMIGDRHAAEDVLQEVFFKVHHKADRFNTKRTFRSWVYAVASNTALDYLRRNKRHQTLSLDEPQTEAGETLGDMAYDYRSNHHVASDDREWLNQSLNRLPEELRDIIDLIYFEQMKYRQAADKLSVPLGTIKSRINMAKQRLRQHAAATLKAQ